MGTPVVLSYGMGVDSTAILLRWLKEGYTAFTDPRTGRQVTFRLEDLTVLTAHLGDEWPDTLRLVRTKILPLLQAYGIQYVQVARKNLTMREKDGYGTNIMEWDDNEKLHSDGGFRLSDELRLASTLPLSSNRRCTLKFKGWVLDQYLRRRFGDSVFYQVIGFNADEEKRVKKDSKYYTTAEGAENRKVALPGRVGVFPLVEWGWDRQKVEDYCKEQLGVRWPKSCCVFCPFQRGSDEERDGLEMPAETLDRFRKNPEAAAEALMLEFVTLAFNPNIALFAKHGTLLDLLSRSGVSAPEKMFLEKLRSEPWSIYHLRRFYTAKGGNGRSIRRYGTSALPFDAALAVLKKSYSPVFGRVLDGATPRIVIRDRKGSKVSAQDEVIIMAPARAQEKERPSFWRSWLRETGEDIKPPAARDVIPEEAGPLVGEEE